MYRNPLEAAIWENGFLGPIMLLGMLGIVLAVGLFTLSEKIIRKNGWRKYAGNVAFGIWVIVGIFYLYGLHYIATN